MSLLDQIGFAVGALRGHRLRSTLTLLGMAIGVASVVLLTAVGEGARIYVTDRFMSLGSNLLIVVPGKTETTGIATMMGRAPRDLTLQDAGAILRQCRRVRRVAPLSLGAGQAGYGDRRREVTVFGSTSDLLEVRHLEMAVGRFLPEIDPDRSAPTAVIGRTVQRELFGEENPLGRPIRIGDWRFRVVGVLAGKGQSLGVDMDDVVIVPVASALRIFNQSSLFRILIEIRAHAEIEAGREEVLATLIERHGGEEDVTLITQDSVLSAFNRILEALTLGLAGIAAISLSVAGIGIMNVMLVTISERTPEVGLLKALGAAPRAILAMFLVESVLLSLAGGAIGLLSGYAGARLLARLLPGLPATPPDWAVAAALAVSFSAGVLFGVLPARRASRLDPVAALARH